MVNFYLSEVRACEIIWHHIENRSWPWSLDEAGLPLVPRESQAEYQHQ